MTNIDQFESVFRSASKPTFTREPVRIESALVITDLDARAASLFGGTVRGLLRTLGDDVRWHVERGEAFSSVRDLLDLVERHRPDLVCTYRNLHTEGWRWPFTLGDHLEVLTQATTTPVLVLPNPRRDRASDHALEDTSVVMAMTDHLTGDDRLVSFAAAFTRPGGRLVLAHIEDDLAFRRYIEVISKIDSVDTDDARDRIERQLLKEPADFIGSCREVIGRQGLRLEVEPLVIMGHRLRDCIRLVEERAVDLLVLNTKDHDQLAMHGLAYPLAVELRQIPILML